MMKCNSCTDGLNGKNGNGYQPCGCKQIKESAQAIHGELHKLARIMEREFGDKVGSFVKQYATQINNDFNNS